MPYALYFPPSTCRIPPSILSVLCLLPLCPMHSTLCSTLHALCPLPYISAFHIPISDFNSFPIPHSEFNSLCPIFPLSPFPIPNSIHSPFRIPNSDFKLFPHSHFPPGRRPLNPYGPEAAFNSLCLLFAVFCLLSSATMPFALYFPIPNSHFRIPFIPVTASPVVAEKPSLWPEGPQPVRSE